MKREAAAFTRTLSAKALPLNRTGRKAILLAGLLLGDALSLVLAFGLAYWLRFYVLHYPAAFSPAYYARIMAVAIPVWLLLFWATQLYSSKILFGGVQEYAGVFSAVATGSISLVVIDFFVNRSEEISRGWLISLWLLALLLAEAFRFGMRHTVYTLRRRGHLLVPALIVNADGEGRSLFKHLQDFPHSGLRVAGFVDDRLPRGHVVAGGLQVLGGCEDLVKLVAERSIEEVIVASGSLDREQLLCVYRAVSYFPHVKLRFSSGLFEIIATGMHIKEMANMSLIEVNKVRITGIGAALKGGVDFIGAALILILLAPLFLLIALLIRLDSAGPIFYKHRVLGLNGEPFGAIKFRTMLPNGDDILRANPELHKQFTQNFKLKNDPRVTRIGSYLRKYSLDELPQFINVLLGQMSIVGPRFISPAEVEMYGQWRANLHTVKPGITGLWQVSGRSDVSYDERVRLDMYYIRNWTIWLDFYLLLATIPAVLSKRGAY